LLLPLAPQIGALVVTGGETARALLPAFGTHSLQLLQEVEPGVPLSVSIGTRSLPVVTKAGAFGSPDALLNAHRMLARLRASTMSNI
jgi:4-hydroxythreonine-4-phosphate dehydrogenase